MRPFAFTVGISEGAGGLAVTTYVNLLYIGPILLTCYSIHIILASRTIIYGDTPPISWRPNA